MATIKAYTDLEQSKKLAKILPLESADMNWHELPFTGFFARAFPYKLDNGATEGLFPCWSLAALLNVLECGALFKTPQGWVCQAYIVSKTETTNYYDNPIDACYEMVIKLHELELL